MHFQPQTLAYLVDSARVPSSKHYMGIVEISYLVRLRHRGAGHMAELIPSSESSNNFGRYGITRLKVMTGINILCLA
jgi:hypothetical protein